MSVSTLSHEVSSILKKHEHVRLRDLCWIAHHVCRGDRTGGSPRAGGIPCNLGYPPYRILYEGVSPPPLLAPALARRPG